MGAVRVRDQRWWRVTASALLLGLTLAPNLRATRDDGFPFSTFPMFAEERPAEVRLAHLVGFDADGQRQIIDRGDLGTIEIVQAVQTVQRAVDAGQAEELCALVAQRISQAELDLVAVVTDTYDTLRYFTEGRDPIATEVHAECTPSAEAAST